MKNLIGTVIFLLAVMLAAFASAEVQTLGTFKQNETVTLTQGCVNSSYSNISRVMLAPDNTALISSDTIMTGSNGFYIYEFTGANYTGEYLVYGHCDEDGIDTQWVYNFYITKYGHRAGDILEVLTWALFIIMIVGNVLMLIFTIVKLATFNETILGALKSWAFYTLAIVVYFMSGLLVYDYITGVTDLFLTIFVWSNGVLPAISLAVTMFVKSTQKKRPLSVEEMTGRFR